MLGKTSKRTKIGSSTLGVSPIFLIDTKRMRQQCLLWLTIMVGSSFGDPIVRIHSRPRGSTTGVRLGNGVVQSQGGTLWITQGDGSLRILSISDDNITETQYRPTPLTNRTMECRSSTSLHEIGGSVQYGVYSVIDRPRSGDQKVVRYVILTSLGWRSFSKPDRYLLK